MGWIRSINFAYCTFNVFWALFIFVIKHASKDAFRFFSIRLIILRVIRNHPHYKGDVFIAKNWEPILVHIKKIRVIASGKIKFPVFVIAILKFANVFPFKLFPH